MARDYLALQNECLQYGYGERERPYFKTWINEASWDVASRHRWRWLDTQTTLSTTANVSFVSVPVATIMIPERLRPNQTTISEPEFVPWNTYAERFPREAPTVARGVPTAFSYNDDKLEFYPTPDAVYSYVLYHYGIPTEMTANGDQPWMPTEHRGVLVSGALMKMAARDKDFNAVQYWSDQYEGQISKMLTANMLTYGGAVRKVAMPKNYGWGS